MWDTKLLEEQWKTANAEENMWRHDTWLHGNEDRDVILSILVSALLRHSKDLVKRSDGYVSFHDLLAHNCIHAVQEDAAAASSSSSSTRLVFHQDDLVRLIENDQKKRYGSKLIDGVQMIRANQAHSISVVDDFKLCGEPLLPSSNLPSLLYHATNSRKQIEETGGLKTMGRNHVHFAAENYPSVHLLRNAQTVAICNTAKATAMGIVFFQSENGVILTRGLNRTVPLECLSFTSTQSQR